MNPFRNRRAPISQKSRHAGQAINRADVPSAAKRLADFEDSTSQHTSYLPIVTYFQPYIFEEKLVMPKKNKEKKANKDSEDSVPKKPAKRGRRKSLPVMDTPLEMVVTQ
jgi:hypothetical protein